MQTWTIKQLDEISDIDFAIRILRERYNKLTNVYSPLSRKIARTIVTLEKQDVQNTEQSDNHPCKICGAPMADIGGGTYACLNDDDHEE